MNNRLVKSLMLSLLLCPGAGHWHCERKFLGATFITITILLVLLMMVSIVSIATPVAEQIVNGSIAMPQAVQSVKMQLLQQGGLARFSVIAMLVVWVIAACDCFRVAR